jgi:hypothetical protein
MKKLVFILFISFSCQDNIYYNYDSKVVEEYSEHFRTLDSINKLEEGLLRIQDSIEEAQNESIYTN